MNNFREVNDDIIKEWLEFREETAFCEMSAEDKKHNIYFEENEKYYRNGFVDGSQLVMGCFE